MFVQEDTTHSGIDHQPANPRISTKDHGPKKSTSNPSPAHRAVDDVGKTDPRKIFLHIMYRSHCCCCVCLDSQAKTPKGPSPVPASSSALPHPPHPLGHNAQIRSRASSSSKEGFCGDGSWAKNKEDPTVSQEFTFTGALLWLPRRRHGDVASFSGPRGDGASMR